MHREVHAGCGRGLAGDGRSTPAPRLRAYLTDEIGGARCSGRAPLLSDSGLVCLAVAQALLGFHSEARWLRYARKHLTGMFPYLPSGPVTTSG